MTDQEKARLLQRAASTIRDYRELVAYSETPATDGVQGDIVFELNAMASAVDLFPSELSNADRGGRGHKGVPDSAGREATD